MAFAEEAAFHRDLSLRHVASGLRRYVASQEISGLCGHEMGYVGYALFSQERSSSYLHLGTKKFEIVGHTIFVHKV